MMSSVTPFPVFYSLQVRTSRDHKRPDRLAAPEFHLLQPFFGIVCPAAERVLANDPGELLTGLFAEPRSHFRVGVACFIERFACVAI
jgi:hypothetical protein